ncbi:MAG TPA: CHASE2 domain-containing protein, partial [Allocoleopsis sp.]
LARSLADLHIPQVIVMREPVPDRVAQKFLQCFLSAFFSGQSLYAAVRTARESLQGLETQYPCATWLPIICQNPAEVSATWEMWCMPKPVVASQPQLHRTLPRSRSTRSRLTIQAFKKILVFSLLITVLSMGMRYVGLLQSWELSAFDQMTRLRPPEPPDSRLLIVAVTEEDLRLPVQTQRKGSLSDLALAQLLDRLLPLQPRAIGLDIYRDFSASSTQPKLIDQLRQNPAIFAICKVSDQTINHAGIAPPPEVPLARQGFSDVLEDPDRVLRRQLLAMDANPTSPCTTPYALSAQLAFHFLEAEGIPIRYTPDEQLQIGNVTFQRLQNYTGSYHNI